VRTRHRDIAVRELAIIGRQIQHMARLVDDLLDVSRLRRGVIALRHESFNLIDTIDRAVEMTAPIFEEQKHQLTLDLPECVTVLGDPVRMAQVFANLLSNAAKYTEPGGHIALSGKVEGDTVVVACRDDGIGMSPELTPHVFELFVQGERGTDRRQGGLGLGLALARALVERHHGMITAESSGPGTGSTFTVRLPCAVEGMSPSEASFVPLTADFALRPARVLVVDDNRDAVEMLVAALRDSGFEATGALEAIEALALAAKVEPHVAVLDIGLPSMDGFQLARMLRRAAPTTIRLIALTGYGQDHDMSAARDAGFERFFVKPASTDALVEAINELLTMPSAR
jgi:CheY-like chemotaxis protein/two-component sensor histidine kinase